MINIFEEISWIKFQQLNHITKLPLNEQVKYYNEYLYDLNESRQSWINSQPKGPRISTPSPYPDFSSPLTYFKLSEGYYTTPGVSPVIPWDRGSLTPSQINDITTITGNQNARWTYFEKFDGTTITNITDLVVGDRLIYQGLTSGVFPDFNLVTNRNSPQGDSATGPSNTNVALPWVSGTTEYIITLSYVDFTITKIVPFIVP